jgi:uncharacterized membrane protein YkvA (DUF1232 family)
MSRSRAILAAVLVGLGALAYGVSPVDVIPELLVGPLGFGDDLAVLAGASFAIWKLLTGQNPGPGRAQGADSPPSAPQG